MTKLQVEVDNFVFAANTMHHNVGESVRITLQGLTGKLQANTDLVGQDSAGSSWAAGYDPAARSVLEATAQIVNAAFRTSQLFAQSGANYARAEAASTTGGGHLDHAELAQLTKAQPVMHSPRLQGSAGAGNGTPSGWWIVEHTVGYVWPGGHQDRLRATAQGWQQAAGGIENVSFDPVLINARFAADRLPEADDVGKVCAGFNSRLEDLARGYRSLGRACDEYADALDECHEAVRSELTELLAESAGIQVVGAIASVFSFGLAQAPTQAAQAARVAAVAARIGTLIEKVLAVARRVAEGVRSIGATAQEITRALQGLAGAKLAIAGVAHVPSATRASRALQTGRGANRGLRMTRSGEDARGLVPRAPHPGRPADFNPPRIFVTRHGKLTNGKFTVSERDMAPHTSGSLVGRKSQFFKNVDADRAVLDAAAYAERNGLFKGGAAKVFVENGPVGVIARTGQPTHWINVYRKRTGLVHGCPEVLRDQHDDCADQHAAASARQVGFGDGSVLQEGCSCGCRQDRVGLRRWGGLGQSL